MKKLIDNHGTGEGYLSTPQSGTLKDIVANVGLLEEQHDVRAGRRLGISLEYRLAALEADLDFEWGSPWIESVPAGPRSTIPASQVTTSFVDAMRTIDLKWLCVGGTNGRETISRLQEIASDRQLGIAAVPTLPAIEVLEREDGCRGPWTLESLLHLVNSMTTLTRVPKVSAAEPRTEQDMLIALAGTDEVLLTDVIERILALQVPVTPLLVASTRRSSLTAVVNAPMQEQSALVLPYHRRLASLRSPGALKMGGKEASKHLGISLPTRQDAKSISHGLDVLSRITASLLEAEYPLIGGSGSPGPGACPGYTLREEYDLWHSLSETHEAIDKAFAVEQVPEHKVATQEAQP